MKFFELIVFAFSESLSGPLTCPSRFVQQTREDGFFYGFSRKFFVRHYYIMFLQGLAAL